jgi:hypothetical protein
MPSPTEATPASSCDSISHSPAPPWPAVSYYLERIAQLTNKTNQFNLTALRYSLADIEAISADSQYIGLYGKLSDRFGDNGLISIVLGRKEGAKMHLDLWLMSCRVLKRDMEIGMLDALVERAGAAGVETLLGYYIPTKKNGIVADHYEKLGFTRQPSSTNDPEASAFALSIAGYTPRNGLVKVTELVHGHRLGVNDGHRSPTQLQRSITIKVDHRVWRRWHITLAQFITTFLYTLIVKSFRKATLFNASIVLLQAMAIAGIR